MAARRQGGQVRDQMNINRAGKQQKACWRSEKRLHDRWVLKIKWQELQRMLQGHAAGWIAGVRWAKKQKKGTK